ncbi:hypothetical protein BAU15_14350 [Enterococcus sp. JM4C]|uniref:DUF58 domain-containing protein n=1 Tax=Candidatus Enterococcus huntleyi TaxID=1857217 RepID=UPI00137A8479|nr:DUF58 domain-containing protein [Enterococcus sp. JM4C]KAF1298859.1 hypothetical protein BAU15_14350 [Enterococcus sp. JM4C]
MRKRVMIGRLFLVGLFYLVFLFYAIIFNNDTGWTVLFFVTLGGLAEILSFISPLSWLSLKSEERRLAHLGEQLTVTLTSQRRLPVPLFFSWLTFHVPNEKRQQTLATYLGQRTTIDLSLTPMSRGWLKKQPIEQIGGDLFGWFEKKRLRDLSVDWLILPAHHPAGEAILAELSTLIYQDYSGESTYLIKNYRAYQQGDSLKQIDWKTSSRKQELILREYERTDSVKWTFVFYGIASPYFEETLSLFYTIAEAYQKKAEFILVGEGLTDERIGSLENYATIQPLENLVSLPEKKGRRMCLFLPELSDELANVGITKSMPMLVYSQLIHEWEGFYARENSD